MVYKITLKVIFMLFHARLPHFNPTCKLLFRLIEIVKKFNET
jgi:hypothetical protein